MLETESDPSPQRPPDRPKTRTLRRRVVVVMVVLWVLLVPVAVSYGKALTAPGDAAVSLRTVGWLRDHGVGPLVDLVEYWVYSHNQATGTTPDPASLPAPGAAASVTSGSPQPPTLPLTKAPRLPGEAEWVPSVQRVAGLPPLYTGYFRPDPETTSLVAGVAWMNQSLVRAQLISGTADPGFDPSGHPADDANGQVPTLLRRSLLTTFNAGFRLKDAQGGYYAGGREVRPLVGGAASLVISTDGRIAVGQWGRDVTMSPRIAAVRQNLALIVDAGAPVAGLDVNATSAWGTSKNQLQYTWRSGLGQDAAGNLIYLAGDQFSLNDLAHAMVAAGVVRGMELDIHPLTVGLLTYRPGQASSGAGVPLLPSMRVRPDRYLHPDQRDFLAVLSRG